MQGHASTAAVRVWAEHWAQGGGVGNAGGRMSTAGHSWSDPLINCLLLFYLLQSFHFCIICFPVQVKQRGTFWNLNSEVLELSSCWGKSWSSAPDGFWEWMAMFHCLSLSSKGRYHSALLGHVALIMLSNLTRMGTEPQCLLLFERPLSLNFSRYHIQPSSHHGLFLILHLSFPCVLLNPFALFCCSRFLTYNYSVVFWDVKDTIWWLKGATWSWAGFN